MLPNDRITVPRALMSDAPPNDHYILRVVGDSMIEECIRDGDFIVVLRRDKAQNGELVIALVGDDATLKRYHLEDGGMVRLEPANACMQAIRLPVADVRVQGVVVGLMRRFN